MTADAPRLTPTSHALLGQLALRPWSVYDMTKNVARTLHWFWPRAESVVYAETKRLAEMGLARAKTSPGLRGRPQTVYSISAKGRRALEEWLGTPSNGFSFHFEPLLRVHLSPYGSKEDLLDALHTAQESAEDLLRQAVTIGTEFVDGRHQFQEQVHVRAILFDYLWNFGLGMYLWAEKWIDEVDRWSSVDPTRAAQRRGVELIARCLEEAPMAVLEDPERAVAAD